MRSLLERVFLARAGTVFLVALAVRWGLCLLSFRSVPPTADGAFYHVVAERIAQGEGYTWLWPDGAVTYAAHYPVGYPTMMGFVYALFGPHPGWAMAVNGLLGAGAAWAAYGIAATLVDLSKTSSWMRFAPAAAGWWIALSPSLVAYTPALMTEGVVGAVLLLSGRTLVPSDSALAPSDSTAGSQVKSWLRAGLLVSAATYLRPQSILFAPVFGLLGRGRTLRQRFFGAAFVSAVALLGVAPWTVRNCQVMDRCLLVSANGGWNLLIGTFEEGRGAWVPLTGERVPERCREVFAEAEKDRCFGQAGVSRIRARPFSWLRLVPDKLAATFDHTAAASGHLIEAGALTAQSSRPLQIAEVVSHRLMGLFCLMGVFALVPPQWTQKRRRALLALLVIGAVGFAGQSAALGWGVCALGVLWLGGVSLSAAGGLLVASTIFTAGVHAAFFGAGRYFLPQLALAAPWAGVGAAYIISLFLRGRPRDREDFDRLGLGE